MFRFTKDNIAKTLKLNDGYETTTSYKGKNFRETNHYRIKDGKLFCRSTGKSSWADSHFDNSYECSIESTRRFLRERKDWLKLPE